LGDWLDSPQTSRLRQVVYVFGLACDGCSCCSFQQWLISWIFHLLAWVWSWCLSLYNCHHCPLNAPSTIIVVCVCSYLGRAAAAIGWDLTFCFCMEGVVRCFNFQVGCLSENCSLPFSWGQKRSLSQFIPIVSCMSFPSHFLGCIFFFTADSICALFVGNPSNFSSELV